MTAQRIDPRQLPSEVRRVNRGLMAPFIVRTRTVGVT